jgi:hypothetical protein
MCHVQSLEKDFYLDTLGSFDHDFTCMEIDLILNQMRNRFSQT